MNTITIAEIKRGGMGALDVALNRGAATIMKRNRPAAIVLTPSAYDALLSKASPGASPNSALDWLLRSATKGGPALEGRAMAQRIDDLRSDWQER